MLVFHYNDDWDPDCNVNVNRGECDLNDNEENEENADSVYSDESSYQCNFN